MEIYLHKLFTVPIPSCSGLQLIDKKLYLIGDNYNALYSLDISKKIGLEHPIKALTERPRMEIKSEKKDLEALFKINDYLLALGSGSTPRRQNAYLFEIKNPNKNKEINFSLIYNAFLKEFGMDAADLNIEGGFMVGETLFLFNRGNGPKAQNGVFTLTCNLTFTEFKLLSFQPISLPKIDNIQATITDVCYHNSRVYITAACEDTIDTYLDGVNKGSFWAELDPNTWKTSRIIKINDTLKVEGLTYVGTSHEDMFFWICVDNDDESSKEGSIYELKISGVNKSIGL
ncbi:MAG: hypothetical protein IPO14_03200 [Saprospiraceae bacterium]|nr:hypothetical protein [Saprospiraceae bacterium]